ncbi:hypothetical protein DUI87_03156 [Hirundo rustica rustica]|uniref:ribonuclease H n=1 Tax=Hirundo rustica rustica TaxID=333673 RepID=A0A3M0LKI9_HIRRU|nr:hypothetical protein DUI87_03156 [Hirundo rustica rustica]
MGPDVKNVVYSAARNHGLSWSLWQKVPGETRGRPLGFWSRSYRGSEANYTPTEKEILAAYEGVQAASEVIGTEAQLLLAPRLPVLRWMFKAEVPSTHHTTDATWSKWIALITQRTRIGNLNRPGILEIITNWPEGENFGLMDEEEQEQVTRAEEAPPSNQLPAEEARYALFTDGSCRVVGMNRKWKAAVWSPTRQVAQATEGEGGSSQLAELKAVQLALDIAERERWPKLYLYTDSWMVANALWGWLEKWKKANWQRRGKPIWAADEWKDIATQVEKLPVKVRHVDAHVPKSQANEEHQNNEQVDQAAKIEVSKIDLDWQHKGELFLAQWAHDASGHQGRDATYKWARDRGVDLTTDSISQVICDCETCAAIKQAKRVKPLWYGGRWSKYKYGEAWQIDYITLPQTYQGKRYVLTMVEATTGWLETYPVPHATACNTILGLEKQVLWRHGTPERIESDNGTHFKNSLINNWAREHGIEWVSHIPYHAPASGKVERYNGLLKTTLKALGGGSFKNWEQHLAKATCLVNIRGSTNRAGPAQSEPLHTVDGEKVPVVHIRVVVTSLDMMVTVASRRNKWWRMRATVSPVVYKGSQGGHNVRAVHHPFSQATIRDLCKAHRDYGRDSPYFRGLLRSDLEATVVIPADLRQLFSCLMDSTEFKLWEAAWRQLLREALLSLLTDPETAMDENGNALTLEHLMGEGRWTDPTDQASGIPIKALQTIREHAVTAFFSMVPDGPVIPYYKIMQGTKEAFTKVVERLTQAIEVQVAEVAVREGILREMVFANANGLCRNAILSLPLDPPPTLQDMLWVCQLKVPYMQGNDRDAKSTTPRVAAISGTQQEHIRRPLELTKALHLKSVDWTFLSVNLKEQSTWPVQGKELVVIGDSAGQAIIHHYMDDVLVCAPTDDVLSHALDQTINALIAAGFELQEEKVQRMPPWKYLGLEMGKRTIVPQKLAIKTKWKDIPKKDRDGKDPLSIIEWVFLSHQRSKRMTQPQELVAELIRKARFEFYPPRGQERLYPKVHPASFRSNSWCRETVKLKRPTTWDNKPWALPKGVFFICGDRAWAGIPPRHVGGPCTLGKLSLLSPNKTTLINWHNKISTHSAIQKRDLRALNPDCDSEIVHWAKTKGVAVTIFLPWVSIAKALGELAHLECWVAKQANLTSDALANLLSDEEITRQATLQNQAAIDYLLLLHGHWCEEFEGLCCFNLTSKAEDVHTAIRQMREMVTNIKRETDDWLSGLFTNWGISSWVSSIIKTVLLCLFVLLLIMLAFGLLKRMLYNLISATTHSPSVNHVIAPTEESPEEEGMELEEVPEGAPEDDGRDPDEEEHGLGYPTQHH